MAATVNSFDELNESNNDEACLESGVIKKSSQIFLRQSPGKSDNSSAPDMKVEIPFTLTLPLAKISSMLRMFFVSRIVMVK